MDPGLIAGIIMLVVWAAVTFTTEAPGYVHLLLTLGFFMVIWRITVLGTRRSSPRSRG